MKKQLMKVVFFFRRRMCTKKWLRLEQLLNDYCFDKPYDKDEFKCLKDFFGLS